MVYWIPRYIPWRKHDVFSVIHEKIRKDKILYWFSLNVNLSIFPDIFSYLLVRGGHKRNPWSGFSTLNYTKPKMFDCLTNPRSGRQWGPFMGQHQASMEPVCNSSFLKDTFPCTSFWHFLGELIEHPFFLLSNISPWSRELFSAVF